MTEKKPPTVDERCGTQAGYAAHQTRGESPCDPCRAVERHRARTRYWADPDAAAARYREYHARHREEIRERQRASAARRRDGMGSEDRAAARRRTAARAGELRAALAPTAKHSHLPWTAEDDAIVRATQQSPVAAVAVQLRRTHNAVSHRRSYLRKQDAAMKGARND